MLALEGPMEETAYSHSRRLLARNKTFQCAGAEVGDLAIFLNTSVGEELSSDTDDTGVAAKFHSQTFEIV